VYVGGSNPPRDVENKAVRLRDLVPVNSLVRLDKQMPRWYNVSRAGRGSWRRASVDPGEKWL
jgi:hypothetical protein